MFVGQVNMGGWDANEKESSAKAGNFGFFSFNTSFNILNDNFELFDGVINDQDLKSCYQANL
ncbi:hypothetical protein GCM10025859_57450 [Alicyclobacillus fastidiosus]|nr:hypothetical protein GCM10025859_57450 [Alicyclobacillus fastidiosus]